MEAINSFKELFLEVWNDGIFGLNASEIIIGFIIFLVFYVLRRLFARFIIRLINSSDIFLFSLTSKELPAQLNKIGIRTKSEIVIRLCLK